MYRAENIVLHLASMRNKQFGKSAGFAEWLIQLIQTQQIGRVINPAPGA